MQNAFPASFRNKVRGKGGGVIDQERCIFGLKQTKIRNGQAVQN